jgi:L-rhamnose mutarotase
MSLRKDRRRMETLEKRSQDLQPPKTATPRYAFNLRIKADCIEEYELEHTRVWPELLAKLKEVGISDYSIFRRGQDLTLVLRCDDFEKAWETLDKDPVNLRWQEFMSRLFEPVPGKQNGERFAMCKEVFYLP